MNLLSIAAREIFLRLSAGSKDRRSGLAGVATLISHRHKLGLDEWQVEVALLRWEGPALWVTPQSYARVENCGCAICVYHRAAREAPISICTAWRWQKGMREMLPVDQVLADRVAPNNAKIPFTPVHNVLIEPAASVWMTQQVT